MTLFPKTNRRRDGRRVPELGRATHGILRLGVCLLILLSCSPEKSAWESSVAADTIPAYEEFLKKYPDSEFSEAAEQRIISLHFEAAARADTIEAYQRFQRDFPESPLAADAASAIESIDYRQAVAVDSMESYLGFLAEYPSSSRKGELYDLVYTRVLDQLDGEWSSKLEISYSDPEKSVSTTLGLQSTVELTSPHEIRFVLSVPGMSGMSIPGLRVPSTELPGSRALGIAPVSIPGVSTPDLEVPGTEDIDIELVLTHPPQEDYCVLKAGGTSGPLQIEGLAVRYEHGIGLHGSAEVEIDGNASTTIAASFAFTEGGGHTWSISGNALPGKGGDASYDFKFEKPAE